jgi:hypothetical protein
MPRKRWCARLSYYDVPVINPADRNAVDDHDLVRHALEDFDELAVLSSDIRKKLVEDLVDALRYARAGLKAGKRHVSNKALVRHVFLSDIGRAMERVGIPVKGWQKWYDGGSGESLFYG